MSLALYECNTSGSFDYVFIACLNICYLVVKLHWMYRVLACGCVINSIYMEPLGQSYDTVSGSLFTVYTLQKRYMYMGL